jgi:hypothetical protein
MNRRKRNAPLRLHVESLEDRFALAGDALLGVSATISFGAHSEPDSESLSLEAQIHSAALAAGHVSSSLEADINAAFNPDLTGTFGLRQLLPDTSRGVHVNADGSLSIEEGAINAALADAVAMELAQGDVGGSQNENAGASINLPSGVESLNPAAADAPTTIDAVFASADEAMGSVIGNESLPASSETDTSAPRVDLNSPPVVSAADVFPINFSELGLTDSTSGPIVTDPTSGLGIGDVASLPAVPGDFADTANLTSAVGDSLPVADTLVPTTPTPVPATPTPQSSLPLPVAESLASGAPVNESIANGLGTPDANLLDPRTTDQRLLAFTPNQSVAPDLTAGREQVATQ